MKVQACTAGDLHAIASDCGLHVSTARTLSCCARNVSLPSRPAQYGASVQCIEPAAGSSPMPLPGCKQSAQVIHVAFAGSGNNRSAIHDVQLGKSGNIGRERSHLLSELGVRQRCGSSGDHRQRHSRGCRSPREPAGTVQRRRWPLGMFGIPCSSSGENDLEDGQLPDTLTVRYVIFDRPIAGIMRMTRSGRKLPGVRSHHNNSIAFAVRYCFERRMAGTQRGLNPGSPTAS